MINFLHRLGFHFWTYYDGSKDIMGVVAQRRRCRLCPATQELFVMGTPGVGIEETWEDVDVTSNDEQRKDDVASVALRRKTQQSFVIKDGSYAVGQLTVFYTGDECTGGAIHLHQGKPFETRYTVHIKPGQTTYSGRK